MDLSAYLKKHESAAALARKLGISPGMISHILCNRRKPSALLAKAVEQATGGKVPKYELRPDVFDPPRKRAA